MDGDVTKNDLISRQAAIDVINHELRCGAVIDQCGLETAHDLIEELPSIEPEPNDEWRKRHYQSAYSQGFVDGCKSYERNPSEPEIIRSIETDLVEVDPTEAAIDLFAKYLCPIELWRSTIWYLTEAGYVIAKRREDGKSNRCGCAEK